jgi:hypothetical protein
MIGRSASQKKEAPVVRFIVLWKNTPTDVEAFERHYREVHIHWARSCRDSGATR